MKKIVILTGAGVSAESGISTFRGAGGLWEGHSIYEVASPQGWASNPELVLNFYNERRKKLLEVQPNAAHFALAELEHYFDTHVITQNVDDLHERGGSKNIIHLHGELFKSQSSRYHEMIYDCKNDIHLGDVCEKGAQLRPFIVWFGEQVPMMERAIEIASRADIFIVVGTSLLVYPAAGLIDYVRHSAMKYIIDPQLPEVPSISNIEYIQANATAGVPALVKKLIAHERY